MGWENVFHCEWNPFGQRVLHHYWPNAIQYSDITKTDFTKHYGTIDIISGGFPCQPYSMAGKRKGKEDERHLWPQMLRAIREVQPRWVVGENVLGLVNWSGGLVFDEVQTDLEAAGYEVFPYVLPACGKDAPHRRDRIWFVARHTKSNGEAEIGKIHAEEPGSEAGSDTIGAGGIGGVDDDLRTSSHTGLQRQAKRQQQPMGSKQLCEKWTSANTCGQGLQGRQVYGAVGGIGQGGEEQSDGFLPPTWEGFPTQSPLCFRNDGLSTRLDTTAFSFSKWRNESIKAGGNAIVPQVVYEIFKAIEKYENMLSSDQNVKGSDTTGAS
jgi:DNA (cytosine-5)-methyltransferase 1